MKMNALFNLQKAWSENGLTLLRELLPLMSPVGRFPKWTKEEGRTLGELLSACARSSESVIRLCAYGQAWDADVLSRSVLEGTLKTMYLLQSREHFKQRHHEYASDLLDIALLKDHKKAKSLLDSVSNPEDHEWLPIREMLLTTAKISDIEQRLGKSMRRALDNKWGFTGLVGELSRASDPMFSGIAGFCHGYAMSSHILHADTIGTAIALERDLRSDERRELVHLAHLKRLIIDQLVYLEMRLMVGYRYVGHSNQSLLEADGKIKRFVESFGDIYKRWLEIEFESPELPPNQ